MSRPQKKSSQILVSSRALFDQIETWMNTIGVWLFVFIMLSVTTDVIYRYITHSSIMGVVELNELLMVGCFLILAYTQKHGGHVTVELLLVRLSDKARHKVETVALFLTLFICALLTWQTFVQVQLAIDMSLISEGLVQYPLWPAKLCVFIGFLFLSIRLLIQFIDLSTGKITKIEEAYTK